MLVIKDKTKNINEDLYFLTEKRYQLPNDIITLNKLDILKQQTMENYRKAISKIENKINFGIDETLQDKYDAVSNKLDASNKTLEYEMTLFFELKDKINVIGNFNYNV